MNFQSPWDTLIIAICIGTTVHLCISLLMLLKNIGARVYLVVQLMCVWYLLPVSVQLELADRVRQVSDGLLVAAQCAGDAALKYYYASTGPAQRSP